MILYILKIYRREPILSFLCILSLRLTIITYQAIVCKNWLVKVAFVTLMTHVKVIHRVNDFNSSFWQLYDLYLWLLQTVVQQRVIRLVTCCCADCVGDSYKCNNSNVCIPASTWCDGNPHCSDNSDEPRGCSTCEYSSSPLYASITHLTGAVHTEFTFSLFDEKRRCFVSISLTCIGWLFDLCHIKANMKSVHRPLSVYCCFWYSNEGTWPLTALHYTERNFQSSRTDVPVLPCMY